MNCPAEKQIVSSSRQQHRSRNQENAQVNIAVHGFYGVAESALSANGAYDRQDVAGNHAAINGKK